LNKAFTLAEVLITLAIIGVVAAITVPSLYANYTRQEAAAKLKKGFSVLNQAYMRAKADGNDWEYWAESANTTGNSTSGVTKNFVEKYVLPYVIYTKTKSQGVHTYVYLNDGSYFYAYKGSCLDFVFDINGDKKPNIMGRDKFAFLYCPYSTTLWIANGVVIPYQKKETKTREQLLAACKNNGRYCSALVMNDNWTFKEDYPYNI